MKASGPAQLSRHSQAAPAKMAQWFEEALGCSRYRPALNAISLRVGFSFSSTGPTLVKNFVMQ